MKLLFFLICLAFVSNFASAEELAKTGSDESKNTEKSNNSDDLLKSQNVLVKKLSSLSENNQLTKDSEEVKTIFTQIDEWNRLYDQRMKRETEKERQETQLNLESQKKTMAQREARWQAAKAKGMSSKQFELEERKRNQPGNQQKFIEFNRRNLNRTNENLKYAMAKKEILTGGLAVREKYFGKDDSQAEKYKGEIKNLDSYLGVLKFTQDLSRTSLNHGPEAAIKKATTPKAEDIFKSYFETPVSNVSQLTGTGFSWLGYRVWVRFKSNQPVKVKNWQMYVKKPVKNHNQTFIKVCPGDRAALTDLKFLECFEKKNTSDNEAGVRLLRNTKLGLYWLQAWGGS